MESLKCVPLDNENIKNIKISGHQQYNSEQSAHNYQQKKSKLMTVDEENVKPGIVINLITKILFVISSFNRTYFVWSTVLNFTQVRKIEIHFELAVYIYYQTLYIHILGILIFI